MKELFKKWWFWALLILLYFLFLHPFEACHSGLSKIHCHNSYGLLDFAMPFNHVH